MIVMFFDIVKRMVALFLVSALATVGAGAIVGLDVARTAILAGILGIAHVVEDLARGYLNDGRLTQKEVNYAFVVNTPEED